MSVSTNQVVQHREALIKYLQPFVIHISRILSFLFIFLFTNLFEALTLISMVTKKLIKTIGSNTSNLKKKKIQKKHVYIRAPPTSC